jgi:SAM-dependent methyltransferase
MPFAPAKIRTLVPVNLRHKLGTARYLARALRDVMQWRPVSQERYTELFTADADPFGYQLKPSEFDKFEAAIDLLKGIDNDARFGRVWEIGCAEGVFTARLAPLCEQLTAVDYVPLALDRVRARCEDLSNISLARWDLKSDPAPGSFDLIVIMDVLGSLGGRRDIRRARDKLVNALAPGGYLLYGDCFGDRYRRRIEESWWARPLLRGPRNVLRLVAAHSALIEVARRETSMHLLVLFRNRKG